MPDPILIVGAGGFVGGRLAREFVRGGEAVIGVSRSAFVADNVVECHVCELRDPADYRPFLQRCRALVHVASGSTPGSTAARPLLELEQNLRPTLAMLEALQDHPQLPVLYVSSGGTLYSHPENARADEGAAVSPRSYHGAGKIAAEHFIAAWCAQFDASATILRPSNLYGPGQTSRAGFGIVSAAFDKLARGEILHIWGDGSAERDYLYIDDFVRLCVDILAVPMPSGTRILNASSGASVSITALLDTIESVTGVRLARTYDPSRAVDVSRVTMQSARARELYGWVPAVSLRDGLERTWSWFNTIQH